ncbi:hypothetical protein [Gracilinema caldarium]|uniref:hypothetical protein n=1 Tax=Gracilinema caldarium TaxID=215591 RepID=UPI0026F13BFB|nr:hypothetical protein [Gracilinema caldarium]
MKVVLFTSREYKSGAFPIIPRWELECASLDSIGQKGLNPFDLCYLDIDGLEDAHCKRLLKKMRSSYEQLPWGVLDTKGQAHDPAWFFHEGAADYIGPASVAEGFTNQRWKRIQEFWSRLRSVSAGGEGNLRSTAAALCEEPPAFPGWHAVKSGMVYPFYLLYLGPENQGSLKSSLGEKRFADLQNRLQQYLTQTLSAADALLWMQNDAAFLFLIPPEREKASYAVEQCLRIGLNQALVSYERLLLDFTLPLVAALHYAEIPFQPPGKTGTIVAEGINFIFHLAYQRASGGRLTLSDAAEQAIPPPLRDLFKCAEPFEGKKILESRRFL